MDDNNPQRAKSLQVANEKLAIIKIQSEVMLAFMNGAVIQTRLAPLPGKPGAGTPTWFRVDHPQWSWDTQEYRVHPQSQTLRQVEEAKDQLYWLKRIKDGQKLQYRYRRGYATNREWHVWGSTCIEQVHFALYEFRIAE